MFGNMGVLDGISKGKCYVEMSTVDEETVQDVADVSQYEHKVLNIVHKNLQLHRHEFFFLTFSAHFI